MLALLPSKVFAHLALFIELPRAWRMVDYSETIAYIQFRSLRASHSWTMLISPLNSRVSSAILSSSSAVFVARAFLFSLFIAWRV